MSHLSIWRMQWIGLNQGTVNEVLIDSCAVMWQPFYDERAKASIDPVFDLLN